MKMETIVKPITFRDVSLQVPVTAHVCRQCGFTASDVAAAGRVQEEIAEAYRKRKGLLTGAAMRKLRGAKGLTQAALAGKIGVGIASIKRWEKGNIQSESMDRLLRTCLMEDGHADGYSGNRLLSLPRVKLVIRRFEGILQRRLLKKNDKFLYVAKYLWYADMLAYARLGRSMTGAAYAAITYGPQLNNYRDLIDEIKQSDESAAEPLSSEEADIIRQVAEKFPEDRMVYDAAHRERVWIETPTGQMISYARALEITGI
jgi:putative zinc finger/helix-turn-helix YgiT family protein